MTAAEIAAAIGRPVAMARRLNWDYPSSHAVQELQIELTDGSMLDVLFKDLGADRQLEEARRTRPAFLYNPRREIEVYRDVLSRAADLDTPAFYGAVIDERPDSVRYWLFIECVRGAVPLWQCELDLWPAAARWLKRLHSQPWESLPASLLRHDAAYYQRWIERAVKFRPQLQLLAKNYGRVVDRLTAMRATFIHGEFYPSNILVQDSRIRPVDWETAAVGPGLIDLAALGGGRFDDDRRAQLAREYGADAVDLDFCRLHLAVQWIGWSADWTPPKEHAHDWFAEVMSLAWKLGVA